MSGQQDPGVHDDAHDAYVALPPYTPIREGETRQLREWSELPAGGPLSVVDPVLGNLTPVYEYAPNTWGPREADRIIERESGWHNPILTEPVSVFKPHTHG